MSRTGVLSSTSWPSSSSPTNFTGQPPPRRKQWNQRRWRPATAQRPALQAQRSQVQQSIVLVHPFTNLGGSQGLLRGIAINLAERGYAAVTFDCKGAGRPSHRLRRDPGCDRHVRVGQSGLESPWDCARGFRSRYACVFERRPGD